MFQILPERLGMIDLTLLMPITINLAALILGTHNCLPEKVYIYISENLTIIKASVNSFIYNYNSLISY